MPLCPPSVGADLEIQFLNENDELLSSADYNSSDFLFDFCTSDNDAIKIRSNKLIISLNFYTLITNTEFECSLKTPFSTPLTLNITITEDSKDKCSCPDSHLSKITQGNSETFFEDNFHNANIPINIKT